MTALDEQAGPRGPIRGLRAWPRRLLAAALAMAFLALIGASAALAATGFGYDSYGILLDHYLIDGSPEQAIDNEFDFSAEGDITAAYTEARPYKGSITLLHGQKRFIVAPAGDGGPLYSGSAFTGEIGADFGRAAQVDGYEIESSFYTVLVGARITAAIPEDDGSLVIDNANSSSLDLSDMIMRAGAPLAIEGQQASRLDGGMAVAVEEGAELPQGFDEMVITGPGGYSKSIQLPPGGSQRVTGLQAGAYVIEHTRCACGKATSSSKPHYHPFAVTHEGSQLQDAPNAEVISLVSYAPSSAGPDGLEVTARKAWRGDEDALDQRPVSVRFQLYNGADAVGDPVEVTEADGWAHTWKGLEPSKLWAVKELDVDERYESHVGSMADTASGFAVTITNVLKEPDPVEPPDPDGTIRLTADKVWHDDGDAAGQRPASIEIQLYDGDEAVGEAVELTEANGWNFTWDGLSAEGAWTVREPEVPSGYQVEVGDVRQAADGSYIVVANTYDAAESPGPGDTEDPGDSEGPGDEGDPEGPPAGTDGPEGPDGPDGSGGSDGDFHLPTTDTAAPSGGSADGGVVQKVGDSLKKLAQTGDAAVVLPLALVAFASLCAAGFIVLRRRACAIEEAAGDAQDLRPLL